MLTRRAMARQGFQYLRARLPNNNGFDGVFLKNRRFVIVETKFNAKWRVHLSKLKTGERQMSREWIEINIGKMKSGNDPALRDLGNKLESALKYDKIDLRVHLVGPSGGSRWSTP